MTAPLRRRRPEARPEEILAAALDVFTQTGFASARVEDIARRAGLSKGAVYLYFPSKEAMLEALVEQSAARVADALSDLAEAGAELDPEVALRTGLRMALSTLSQPEISAAPRLILAEAARFPDLANFYRQRVINVGQAALTRILTAGMEQGVFRTVQTPVALRAFMGRSSPMSLSPPCSLRRAIPSLNRRSSPTSSPTFSFMASNPPRLITGSADMRTALSAFILLTLTACAPPATEVLYGYAEGDFLMLAPETSGRVETVRVTDGQRVTAGEPLLSLESEAERLALEAARQQAEAAEARLADASTGGRRRRWKPPETG